MNFAHYVYRLYDVEGRLLYVGLSRDVMSRIAAHARTKPWYFRVASMHVRAFADRDAAAQAEETAIRNEAPLHNVQHRVAPGPNAGLRWVDCAAVPGERCVSCGPDADLLFAAIGRKYSA